jgi:hypothetical protein
MNLVYEIVMPYVLVLLACLGIIAVYGLASRRLSDEANSIHGPVWPHWHPDHPEVGEEATACRCGRPGTPEEHIEGGADS